MISGNIIINYTKSSDIDYMRNHVHSIISRYMLIFYGIKRILKSESVIVLDIHFINYIDVIDCLKCFSNEKCVTHCFYKKNISPDKNYNFSRPIDEEFLSVIETNIIELSIITSDNYVYYN